MAGGRSRLSAAVLTEAAQRAVPAPAAADAAAVPSRFRAGKRLAEDYEVGWLLPQDASRAAELEARIHKPEHRAGEALIAAQLETTEWGGRNLSLGLYRRASDGSGTPALVGSVLAFAMRDRSEVGEFFDAPVPAGLDPDEPTIYIADWAVEPEHRAAIGLMVERFVSVVRADTGLRGLPLTAFGTPEYAQKWSALRRFTAAAGWELAGRYEYFDAKLGRPMFWLHFERVGEEPRAPMAVPATGQAQQLCCRVVTDLRQWADLKLVWDRLLESSPAHTPWQGYAFLTLWWRCLGDGMPLRIFVVERGGEPCLAVPMQISSWRRMPGMPVRLLEPIGMLMDVNRPRLGLGELDPAAYRCAFEAIWARSREWDVIRIDEKPWDDAETALLRDYALERSCVFRQVFSHLVPEVDLRQSWGEFVKGKSQKLRKNLKAARRKLEQRGAVTLRAYESEQEVEQALEIMLELHEQSWKSRRKVEYSRASGYAEFFSSWAYHMAATGRCRILVLFCGENAVAATAAFTDGDTYYSAQIVHDASFADCSPGTLLEAMELEMLMGEGRYARYDMLGSFLSNKMRWASAATKTAQALVLQRRLRTFLMDAYFFSIKPYIRPALLPMLRALRLAKG